MPSFLTDENAPIYTQSADIVELKPSNDFAKAIDRKEPRPVSRATNESVSDGVSARSSQTSHDPDNRDQMNGAGTRPTSMSSFTNGISRGGQSGSNASDVETVSKPAQNGDDAADASPGSSALPAISGGPSLAVPPLTNGTGEADLADAAKPPSPQASTQKRASVSSSGGPGPGSVQQSPVDLYPKQNRLGDGPSSESGPVPTLATIPSSSVPASFAPSPSLAPETQTPTPTPDATKQSSHPPHRFSSPPVYHHSAGPSGASTYGPQQPPQSGLRHRHTLEVPKVAPGRGSRDGADGSTAAHATGRFSPTAGGGGPSGGGGGGRRTSLSLARRNTRSIHSDLAPREEIIPDEDVLRWTEAYRQKRASKRRKREIEDDDRVLVGTKVDESHANWVTAYNMLTGIRVSVSRTNAKLDRPLTMADFEAKQKSTFDM